MLGDHKLTTRLSFPYDVSPMPYERPVKMLNQIMMCSKKLIRILAQDTGKQVAVLEMDKKEWKTKAKPIINGFALNRNGTD